MNAFDISLIEEYFAKKKEENEKQRKKCLKNVKKCLVSIREKYKIKSAFIIGSVLKPYFWDEKSDVDVAVSGCSSHILSIMKEIEDTSKRMVDVIDLDKHPFPQLFKKRGKKIYE